MIEILCWFTRGFEADAASLVPKIMSISGVLSAFVLAVVFLVAAASYIF
jgi:hypothetical protein